MYIIGLWMDILFYIILLLKLDVHLLSVWILWLLFKPINYGYSCNENYCAKANEYRDSINFNCDISITYIMDILLI